MPRAGARGKQIEQARTIQELQAAQFSSAVRVHMAGAVTRGQRCQESRHRSDYQGLMRFAKVVKERL